VHITKEKLKDILVKSGIVAEAEFNAAQDESARLGQTIPNVLIGRGDVTEQYLTELLMPYVGAPMVDLHDITIPQGTLESVPEVYAKARGVIVFEYDKEKGIAKVAMTDPLDYDTIEFLRAKLGAWVEPYFATPSGLKYGLKHYKRNIGDEFNEIISENVKKFLTGGGESDLAKLAKAVPIVVILDSIIEHAIALNASDIHFEALEKELLVRYRVDGILHEILSLHKVVEPILVARVKVLADLRIDEHRTPQDGRFRFEVEEGVMMDIRVNVMPTLHGEKVEMRLLESSARPLSLAELGFSDEGAKIVEEGIKKPNGITLVTGPTGHGKTTTLYAILHILNTPTVNITTIEDPIEYEIPRVNQTQVNVKAGITFANGLRSVLRQNPDIIMVGEIRDNETAEIAVHAALTGHLVLSSLHTNDAPSALPRLLDMGVQAFLVAPTVNIIIAQRLVRKICSLCIASFKVPPEMKRLISAQIAINHETQVGAVKAKPRKVPETLYAGRGCKVCGNTGFHGQIGIFEIMKVTESIRGLLLGKKPVDEIRKQAVKEGMVTMFEDGLNKIEKGVTTIEEILRVVRE